MRWFVLAFLATACGSDPPPEPHDIVACEPLWAQNGYTDCEYACNDAVLALNAEGPACQASSTLGPVPCAKTFEHEGIAGCCATQTPQIVFAECDE